MQSESKLVADELVRTVSVSDCAESAAELPGPQRSRLRRSHPVASREAPAAPFDPAPGAVDRGRARAEPEPAPPAPSSRRPVRQRLTADRSARRAVTGGRREAAGGDQIEALLRATQMAVKGSSREEIEVVLRDQYRVSNPDAILDEILGPDA